LSVQRAYVAKNGVGVGDENYSSGVVAMQGRIRPCTQQGRVVLIAPTSEPSTVVGMTKSRILLVSAAALLLVSACSSSAQTEDSTQTTASTYNPGVVAVTDPTGTPSHTHDGSHTHDSTPATVVTGAGDTVKVTPGVDPEGDNTKPSTDTATALSTFPAPKGSIRSYTILNQGVAFYDSAFNSVRDILKESLNINGWELLTEDSQAGSWSFSARSKAGTFTGGLLDCNTKVFVPGEGQVSACVGPRTPSGATMMLTFQTA